MWTDLSFHIVKELGPGMGLEGRYQLFHFLPLALGALDVNHLVDLVKYFKFMFTFLTPVQIYRHCYTPFLVFLA
jgi:hypothetical protein